MSGAVGRTPGLEAILQSRHSLSSNPLPDEKSVAAQYALIASQRALLDGFHERTKMLQKPSMMPMPVSAPPKTTSYTVKVEELDNSEHLTDMSRDHEVDVESRGTPNSSMTSASLITPAPPQHLSSPPPSSSERKLSSLSQGTSLYPRGREKYRPKSSIPPRLPGSVYAQQCVSASYASRLDPYSLHPDEHRLLRDRLCHLHVTVYLNIRNGILRLWTRNPRITVSLEEAIGCSKDERWEQLATFSYEWLIRRGYINFGCVEIPRAVRSPRRGRRKVEPRPTIVVVGAGMSGLGCARQLHGLFRQYGDTVPPRIIILEGRRRIGGRIHSHPLQSISSTTLSPHQRSTAEMGAQIIVGFEHGNPLDAIIRGQLALDNHLLRDVSTLYDIDGSAVDEEEDTRAERLYNDILDRSGHYRQKAKVPATAEGDKAAINAGRDPVMDDGLTIAQFEEATASGAIDLMLPVKSIRKGVGHKAAKTNKPTEGTATNTESQTELPAARTARSMGWFLKASTNLNDSLDLDPIAHATEYQSLGNTLDEGLKQYQKLLNLGPKDMRLLNWHYANLEYANAANVHALSLTSWDQDIGNEFEGEHAQVVGGYQQVPRGLWRFPEQLDVRPNKIVRHIAYQSDDQSHSNARITCTDGDVIEADRVVLTAPLGVLKQQSIQFEPALPKWKDDAIKHLGFGLLNKVVLVFDKPFWDVDRDMFGLLRDSTKTKSLDQGDYSARRGRSYLFWNCLKTSGLPVLVALMAGDAAHQVELARDQDLVNDVVGRLRNIFTPAAVPDPLETLVTRWGQDRFAHGSYSFVASGAQAVDYDLMARPIGNLFFAGEATCGTHPATVHGAYLSGLRAASEVFESVVGPIEIPYPLVAPSTRSEAELTVTGENVQKRKEPDITQTAAPTPNPNISLKEAYDMAMWNAIYTELGPPPVKPAKTGVNPFLLYQKDHWQECKARCDAARQKSSRNPKAKAGRDEVRQALGQMWRAATKEQKRPYMEQTTANRQINTDAGGEWLEKAKEWDRRTYEVKDKWCAQNPYETWAAERERELGIEGLANDTPEDKKAKRG